MTPELHDRLLAGLKDGSIVPYLGPGVLADVTDVASGAAIPADSDSLILAMNVELKRGRSTVSKFLSRIYGETAWTRAAVHEWLKAIRPPYVVDINRDAQLQDSYAELPHNLVVGMARLGGSDFRYKLYAWDGAVYRKRETIDPALPILFKPMGTPHPEPTYVASDADYVDYITELMGGFAIPPAVKELRRGKQYLLMGMRLNRDTERMVMADIIYAAAQPAGWVLISEPTAKECRFCSRLGLQLIDADVFDLIGSGRVLHALPIRIPA